MGQVQPSRDRLEPVWVDDILTSSSRIHFPIKPVRLGERETKKQDICKIIEYALLLLDDLINIHSSPFTGNWIINVSRKFEVLAK